MKIYTRTGDDGSSGLFDGERVQKSDPRLDCYGTIDELNAALGLAICAAPLMEQKLRAVQNELFVIGSHLATPAHSPLAAKLPAMDEAAIARLEMEIDAVEAELKPLRQFILPGGTEAAARLHAARTICRRAERLVVGFAQDRPVPGYVITYVNRLSDWLFAHARWCNHRAGVEDIPWTK